MFPNHRKQISKLRWLMTELRHGWMPWANQACWSTWPHQAAMQNWKMLAVLIKMDTLLANNVFNVVKVWSEMKKSHQGQDTTKTHLLGYHRQVLSSYLEKCSKLMQCVNKLKHRTFFGRLKKSGTRLCSYQVANPFEVRWQCNQQCGTFNLRGRRWLVIG